MIALRAELETFQAQAEAIRADAAAGREGRRPATERIEAMQSEVAHAVRSRSSRRASRRPARRP